MTREPVRVILYPILAAIVAVLVAYGVIDGNVASIVTGALSAVFGSLGVETARANVTPATPVTPAVTAPAAPAAGAVPPPGVGD